jgi:hypothetical protein
MSPVLGLATARTVASLTASVDTTAPAAYRLAPPIADEIAWITEQANHPHADLGTDYYVRKAAALDRIALQNPADTQNAEEADAYAWYVLDSDPEWTKPYAPLPADPDPRVVIRHIYRAWQRADLTAKGRCPNCGWLDYQCNCADHPNA